MKRFSKDEIEAMITQMALWLQPFDKNTYHVYLVDGKQAIKIKFWTNNSVYSIRATPDYLGCVRSCRKVRAGEKVVRGNDLPDGKFSQNTWNSIITQIVASELVKLHAPIRNS
jgi:hypothetical protein